MSLHTPHSNASSSDMQSQQQQQQSHFHQQTQVTMNVPWQQHQQQAQQSHMDRRMSFTAPNPPMYAPNTVSAPPNILTTMLPPASTAYDLQNPSPTGFLDPNSLSTGSSTLQLDQGGSHHVKRPR